MEHKSIAEDTNGEAEKFEPVSPGVDYGLKSDDGFDPSKYDFYNPSLHAGGKAFVVRLDERQAAAYTEPDDPHQPQSDLYEDSPSPLSPIEELDDDEFNAPPPRRSSDPGVTPPRHVEESKPDDFSLDEPEHAKHAIHPLEQRSELLFSRQHLQLILANLELSLKFTEFLRTYRPDSVPILAYYLDVVKALKTIKYAESIINGLEPIPGHEFTTGANSATMAWVLEDKADRALDTLVKDDLPAFVAYVYVRTVDVALVDRVTGREDPKSRGVADGLAEVFVLSDPARPDNPIIFTSEEFHKMTGYPRNEFLGRNCRTLGGPRTSTFGISRFRTSLDVEREHCEVLLNYRKDGTPFINLIMCVPLRDQSGKVRYYLGAQVDVTDLVYDCTGLQSLKRLMQRYDNHRNLVKISDDPIETIQQDEFDQLSETFNPQELEKLIKLRQRQELESEEKAIPKVSNEQREERASSKTPMADLDNTFELNGEGSAPPLGYYKTYLLVRPAPSLRILFASPDLRMPGILQSPLLNSIGGSTRVRDDLAHALSVGRKVTAKVQWLSKTAPKSRARWIHCTPLLGVNDAIGVWMVILVDDEVEADGQNKRQEPTPRIKTRKGTNYTAEALPWDAERQNVSPMGVSTSVWSEGSESKNRPQEPTRNKLRKPLLRQPSDSKEPTQLAPITRPGPKIAGKAYSYNSSNDGQIAVDDGYSTGGDRSRPNSSSSSIPNPIQISMQPKVMISGRQSADSDSARKPQVRVPYGLSADGREDGARAVRRTYKSLSPYGILFQD